MSTTKKLAKQSASTNQVGEVIDIRKAVCREFDVQEIYQFIKQAGSGGFPLSWSWGLNNALVVIKNKALRFTVQGHNHKGYVYLVLNGLDLFDIYYTSTQDNIKKVSKDVYLMDLIQILDKEIEWIPEYDKA